MDDHATTPNGSAPNGISRFPASLYDQLRKLAADSGHAVGPEVVIDTSSLTPFLGRLMRAGGS